MKIERSISVFNRHNNELVTKIDINDFTIEILKKIFIPFEDNPNFYRPYEIFEEEFNKLIKYKKELEKYPLSKYQLYNDAVSVD